jgi:hypothetical protein
MWGSALTALDRCDVGGCPARAQARVIWEEDRFLLFCGHHIDKHYLACVEQGGWIDDQRPQTQNEV